MTFVKINLIADIRGVLSNNDQTFLSQRSASVCVFCFKYSYLSDYNLMWVWPKPEAGKKSVPELSTRCMNFCSEISSSFTVSPIFIRVCSECKEYFSKTIYRVFIFVLI